jgi:hypothetical protein
MQLHLGPRPLLCATALTCGILLAPAGAAAGGGYSPLGWALLPLGDQLADALLASVGGVADPCAATANVVARGRVRGAQEDFAIAIGNCVNVTDPAAAAECLDDAAESYLEDLEQALEQHGARLALCELLGEGPYDPEIDPDDFVDEVDNPYFPLVPGTTLTYHKLTGEGLEVTVVEVTEEKKEILGIDCTVVHDSESEDGELVEDTLDYFAQDKDGNVWYFGELSLEYEDGEVAGLEGSWIAGEDGAKPGIIMQAAPSVGTTYRQEFFLGEAEDAATVLALDERVSVPYGTFKHCLVTEDFNPLEPGNSEEKSYAPGIGMVLEVDSDDGSRNELVDVTVK